MKQLLCGLLLATHVSWVGAGEIVSFPGDGLELRGALYLPDGRGPFPAIVLQHGCSGLWARGGRPTASYAFWADHFRNRGFLALHVDSFGPRGEREICTQSERRIRADRDRPRDAHAALRWLAARSDVDARRIYLMGWSNGGTSVLHAMQEGAGSTPGFGAAVALYPGCRALSRRAYQPSAPVLILAGGADDWTPAGHCEQLAKEAKGPVRIEVYPGAHHAFDRVDGRTRYRANVRNPTSPTGWGATVGPHPEARAKAVSAVSAFIDAH